MILIHRRIHIPRDAAVAGWERDWRALEEVCIGLFDCPHSTPKLALSGPYVVRSQDIRSGVFRLEEAAHVSRETYQQRIARAEPRYGDLIYSREGTYFGIAAEVPKDVEVCLGQRMVLVRPDPQLIDHQYLLYWLNSPVMARHIHGHRDGSVAERLNMPTIRGLPVPLLPIQEQRAIASVLSALDYKIELNRRMNETLEALARALFKSWFVDFGPVRAKAEGRKPFGMDDATAAVFPDRFGPDGLPEGWHRQPLAELTDVLARGIAPSYVDDGGIAVINQRCVRGRRLDLSKARRHDPARRRIAGREVEVGDVLVNSTGQGTLGRVAYVLDLPEPAIADGHVAIIRADPSRVLRSYLGLDLTSREAEIEGLGEGSTGQTELSRARFGALLVPVPPLLVQEAFDSIVAPLLTCEAFNSRQSNTLAALRDLLLPKLISGEIMVSNAKDILSCEG